MCMKTTTFRIWETNKNLLDTLKDNLEKKRGQVLSRNLVISEALKRMTEEEGFSHE